MSDSGGFITFNLKRIVAIVAVSSAVGGLLWKGFVLVDSVDRSAKAVRELTVEVRKLRQEVDHRFDRVHATMTEKLEITGGQIITLHDAVHRLVVLDEVRGYGNVRGVSASTAAHRAREAREGLRVLSRPAPAERTKRLERLDNLPPF